jgi:quercetin dioxygenase-like cupin family protein
VSEKQHDNTTHRRPDAEAMAAPHLQFDLTTELQQLRREPEWTSGHNSKTLVKHDSLRVVLISLKARARIPEHQTEGRISIQTIQGYIRVRSTERTFDLPTGTLLALDQGLRHDVEALEDSAFLLSIAWPERRTIGSAGTQA